MVVYAAKYEVGFPIAQAWITLGSAAIFEKLLVSSFLAAQPFSASFFSSDQHNNKTNSGYIFLFSTLANYERCHQLTDKIKFFICQATWFG